MIEEYHFGTITIDGKVYNNDVEVCWTGEVLAWNTKESHIIDVADIERTLTKEPETIVIGSGESGAAQVTDAAKNFIRSKRIELIIDNTLSAVGTFNIINEESLEEDGRQRKVIGLFHLTC